MHQPKMIAKKTVGDKEYEIMHWPQENRFIIYSLDIKNMGDGIAHNAPEIASFKNEEDARDYLNSL